MKIRDKRTGEVIDLAILRANLDGGVPWATALIDALESALSVPHMHENNNPGAFGFNQGLDAVHDAAGMIQEFNDGFNIAVDTVREAAGVIEE